MDVGALEEIEMGIKRSTLALSLTLLTGCISSRTMMVHPQSDPQEKTLGIERQRVTGYTLKGGERLAFDGYVEARGETLRFVRLRIESRGLELSKPPIVRDVPRDSVVAVAAAYTNVPATVFLGIGLVGVVVLIAGLALAASLQNWGFAL